MAGGRAGGRFAGTSRGGMPSEGPAREWPLYSNKGRGLMGVQRASRHWPVTAVLRENLDFFYDTTMAQTLLLYHRESLGAAESKIERQSKAKTNTFKLLVDAYRMHRARVVPNSVTISNPRSHSWQSQDATTHPEGLVKAQEIPKSQGRVQSVRPSSR